MARIDHDLKPNSFALTRLEVKIKIDLKHIVSACANLLGMIEGSDPELRKEYIVIGAHLDHVGLDVVPLLSFPMLGNSDHYFFALEKVPSVFFFTGGNEYAHTPLDTVERINAEKMAAVIRLACLLAFSLADEPHRLSWKQ